MDQPTFCGLRGCGRAVVAAEPGRPPRRYCSPEHHAHARMLAMEPDGHGSTATDLATAVEPIAGRRATDQPFASSPRSSTKDGLGPGGVLGPVTALPALARPGRTVAGPVVWTTQRRAPRGLAVGVAAGLVAATALFWSGPAAAPLFGDGSQSPAQADHNGEDWSTQAVVTLASIRTQLDEIDQTTRVWNSEIAPQYQGQATPAQVRAMMARKVVLEQQQAALSTHLLSAQQLAEARADLRGLDQQLASIDAALNSGAPSNPAAGPNSTVAALQSARTLTQQSRDAKAAEVARLAAGARAAAQEAPIPDRADQTAPVTQAVLQLDTRKPTPTPSPQQPPSALAAGGPDGRRPTAQVTTGQPVPPRSEPLRPQRSGMGPDGRPSTAAGRPAPAPRSPLGAVTGAVTGTVGAVADTAKKVLSPGSAGRADKPAAGAPRPAPERPVRRVADTATGAVTGTAGAVADTADRVLAPATRGRADTSGDNASRSRPEGPARKVTDAATGAVTGTVGAVADTADQVLSPATSVVTGTVGAVGDAAQKLLSPRTASSSTASTRATANDSSPKTTTPSMKNSAKEPRATSSASASSTRSDSGGGSGSRAAQLAYAAELVKGTPAESWAGPAIELAQQLERSSTSGSTSGSTSSSRESGSGRHASSSSADNSGVEESSDSSGRSSSTSQRHTSTSDSTSDTTSGNDSSSGERRSGKHARSDSSGSDRGGDDSWSSSSSGDQSHDGSDQASSKGDSSRSDHSESSRGDSEGSGGSDGKGSSW